MTEQTPEAPASTPAPAAPTTDEQAPAAATPAPAAPTTTPAKRSLEELLGSLDDDARGVVLGEVSKARNEAKNLRERLKEAEPKLTEYDRLAEANKTELERAQESAKTANDRATGLLHDVATARLEVALTGVPEDVKNALLEDINLDKFITDDGVNTEAITSFGTKYAAFTPTDRPGMKPNPAQGRSASPAPSVQDQIAQAQAAGDIKSAVRLKARLALDAADNQ